MDPPGTTRTELDKTDRDLARSVIVRMGLAKMEAKSKNFEIVHKYPNVVFSVKMTNFNFCGQSQQRGKAKSFLGVKPSDFLVTY